MTFVTLTMYSDIFHRQISRIFFFLVDAHSYIHDVMTEPYAICTLILAVKFLALILLTWTIWRAPTNASKWRMGFNPYPVNVDNMASSYQR